MPRIRSRPLSILMATAALALGAAAPALAQGSDKCWMEVRSGPAQGMLQAYAAPRLAGSYGLTVRQDGGNGELLIEQSGSFTPYNFWPTTLSRVHVGARPLRPNQPGFWQGANTARPGTTIIAGAPASRQTAPGALPAGAYGFRADLRVYDTAGRLICRDTRRWR